MIEEGDSQLDPVGHGHPVGLQEKIVREPGLTVDIKHPVERRGVLGVFEVRTEDRGELVLR